MAERVSCQGARPATSKAASQRFVAATEQLDGGVPAVSVMGEVDLATVPENRSSNRRLALVLPNSRVLRIFQITQFDELFEIYPSLGAAVNGNGNGHG